MTVPGEETVPDAAGEIERLREKVREHEELERKLRRTDELMKTLLAGTSSETGTGFFRELARLLATTLGVRYAFVAETTGGTGQGYAPLPCGTGRVFPRGTRAR